LEWGVKEAGQLNYRKKFLELAQWRTFKLRASLQENHSGPLLPNNIGVYTERFIGWA